MRLLLDSCALLWDWYEPEHLSPLAQRAIQTADVVCVSAVSLAELAIKDRRLQLFPQGYAAFFADIQREGRYLLLPLEPEVGLTLVTLPLLHKDPFDRLLVSVARSADLTLVTPDTWIQRYDITTLW